jgi:hypothetical protein
LLLSVLALASPARAEITRFAELEGFTRLLEGDPTSVALSEEGAIGLRPRVRERFFRPGMAAGVAGRFGAEVVLARQKPEPALVAINKAGKERVLWPLGNRLVTRLVADGPGLWAATTEGDKAQLTVWSGGKSAARTIEVDAHFVWDVLPDGRGGAWIATGEPGTVSKVDAKGRVKALFAAEEAHLKALLLDDKLGLFAGGGERGIVYVAEDGGKRDKLAMRALYDTGNQEVTSLKSDGGHVYVASVAGQVPSPGEPEVAAGAGGPAPGPMAGGRKAEVRSTLVKVSPEGAGEMLAASNDEVLFDLAFDDKGRLLVATGAVGKGEPRGRLYRVQTQRKQVSLLYQSMSKRITQLLPEADDVVLVEQEGTRLVTLARDTENEGTYLGPTIDTGVVSRFGLVQVLGDLPAGSSARVSVRTGQTSEPDGTWSSFGPAIEAPGNAAISVPNGRYAQVRLQLKASNEAQPQIYKVRLAYLRQNLPPFVQDIFALPHGQAMYALPAGATGDDGHSKVVPLAGKADDAELTNRKMPPRARQVAEAGAMTVRWTVDEPNGDDLEYALFVRAAGEGEFRLVADRIEEPFHTFHSAQLPDGWYTFRVRASDARSNPEALARSDERDSRAILIDNTPPVFRQLKAGLHKGHVTVSGSVSDRHSPLVALEMAVHGGPFRPVLPRDGLLDGLREDLQVVVPDVQSGAHTVTLRSRDESGNVGHAFVRFEGERNKGGGNKQ